jgi:hypothetical protein
MPERIVAPGLLGRARGRGSSALLGGAFAVCAAPCIGTVLASILVLASSSGSIARGVVLLARTRSGSARRSCSPASRSRTRCARSASSATTTASCAARQARRSSRSACCSSSTATGGCGSRLDQVFTKIGLGSL